MKNKLFLLTVLFAFTIFSCSDEKEELPAGQKEATGTVWVSGGLWFCAEQIRTIKGDTLIPMLNGNNVYGYTMGQKVHVVYKELIDTDPGCSGIACEIIKTELID